MHLYSGTSIKGVTSKSWNKKCARVRTTILLQDKIKTIILENFRNHEFYSLDKFCH